MWCGFPTSSLAFLWERVTPALSLSAPVGKSRAVHSAGHIALVVSCIALVASRLALEASPMALVASLVSYSSGAGNILYGNLKVTNCILG